MLSSHAVWKAMKSLVGGGEEPDGPEVAQAKQRMLADSTDARKRFVWCVLVISTTEKADPGYLPEFSRTALGEWYEIESREELLESIGDFVEETDGSLAYNLFRAVFLARAGFGAEILSESESWGAAYDAARKLKQAYTSWHAYGAAYVEAHLEHRESEGDDEDDLEEQREELEKNARAVAAGVWAQTPFDTQI